jgi:hypothetical protein
VAGAASLMLLAPLASVAVPIDATNDRPVVVNAAPAGEQSLSTILNSMVSGLPANYVTNGQSAAGMWQFAANPGSSLPTVVAEFTANSSTQSFGIWFGTDTGSIYAQNIFLGAATGPSPFATTASIQIVGNQMLIGGTPGSVNVGLFTDALINPHAFGFFFSPNGGATKYYSVDQLNADPAARFLAYEVTGNIWAFAYEDGSDFDYNDMVVKVESIKTPEPSILVLLGIALITLQLTLRRQRV